MSNISLRNYGYKMANEQRVRWDALDKATYSFGPDTVIDRLNEIYKVNISSIIAEDIEYMERKNKERIDAICDRLADSSNIGDIKVDLISEAQEPQFLDVQYDTQIGDVTDVIITKLTFAMKAKNKRLSTVLLKCIDLLVSNI